MNKSKSKLHVIESFFNELLTVEKHDRSLVIIAFGYIELFINCIIDVKCKHGKKRITKSNRDYSLSVKLTLLNELGLLDDRLFKILDTFRKIRNRAAHEALFSITPAEWVILNKGLDRFLPNESKNRPNDLAHFCRLLISTIWNQNLDIVKNIEL